MTRRFSADIRPYIKAKKVIISSHFHVRFEVNYLNLFFLQNDGLKRPNSGVFCEIAGDNIMFRSANVGPYYT